MCITFLLALTETIHFIEWKFILTQNLDNTIHPGVRGDKTPEAMEFVQISIAFQEAKMGQEEGPGYRPQGQPPVNNFLQPSFTS